MVEPVERVDVENNDLVEHVIEQIEHLEQLDGKLFTQFETIQQYQILSLQMMMLMKRF